MFAVVGTDIHPRFPSDDISISTATGKGIKRNRRHEKVLDATKKEKISTYGYTKTEVILGNPSQQRGEERIKRYRRYRRYKNVHDATKK